MKKVKHEEKTPTESHEQTEKDRLAEKAVELETKWKRALADYQNLENRVAQQKAMYIKLANASLIEKMVGVMDDLQRAASHVNDNGLNMILKSFETILKEEGVEEIKAQGEIFDPLTMECVEVVSGPKDRIIKVTQKGYKLYESVIRPAKVEVGAGENEGEKNE